MQQSANGISKEVGKGWKLQIITPELLETIVSVQQLFEKEKLQQQHVYVRRPVQTICIGNLDQP